MGSPPVSERKDSLVVLGASIFLLLFFRGRGLLWLSNALITAQQDTTTEVEQFKKKEEENDV